MRDAFAVLFFVSMGMLLDPEQIWANAALIAATLALVVVVKPLATVAIALLLGPGVETALAVGVALAQIGEFSFILAALGRQLGVLPERATQTLVATSIVSITLNPLLYRLVPAAARRLDRRPSPAPDPGAARPRSGRSPP